MPPVAGVVAWLVSDEAFTSMKLGGAAVTLAGVAFAQLSGRLTPAVQHPRPA
jgi:drug/metabolite transporter (DMT)-like permease